ncbi:hypothetical protein CON65_20580 [Bacillus pseudomycoides]|uniref:Uncharacterized protein n=1 Tax=Bacillus pseudomycoides TaxID=64104 RepID=A0AA91ZRW9_9BACI|nr:MULTISPECIES: DUF6886 family protein [Bacillus]PEB51620.1 hypothetical protein COO03_16095 [Bacillus sp. AFS098217]PED80832.1 hypothetical protein CON65_20580 [Bacillus pseudomycoides]PEU11365.1 hypothetical protein CN525_22335 [Bacillus sp. AFS014408]PEU17471.1 hypothetical protein CN524_02005 [Bacillus sp. AFS019443]PFW63564.1 hypothetical protein COL20_08525 [Bacillus sp. AFS075034]
MRIFHVSEEKRIQVFHPRKPTRTDLDPTKGLVWAIDDQCLPDFLMPRNCPRVCYRVGSNTSESDKQTYLSSKSCSHVVVIENKWFETMKNTKLYLYEFDTKQFTLQDENAGYYVSETSQIPIAKLEVVDLFEELFKRNVELRLVNNLWDMFDEIQKTTFQWSMCRMGFAQPRLDK